MNKRMKEPIGTNTISAVYLLGLVMPDPSLSVLLARALPDLPVNEDKDRVTNE